MAWNDRLRSASYTSPGGAQISFSYEDVSRGFEKKTTAYEFPDADGTYVQDLGHTGDRFPIRAFFTGADCDLEAQAFESALMERGTGRLSHPMYGVFDVVPFGEVGRRDDLKTAANQAVVEVTFFSTIGLVYPTAQTDPASAVLEESQGFLDAFIDQASGIVDLVSVARRAVFQGGYITALDQTVSLLRAVASASDDVERQFNAINDSIRRSLSVLASTPDVLAAQTVLLVQAPGRSDALISERLQAFRAVSSEIIRGPMLSTAFASQQDAVNRFVTQDVFASAAVTGAIIAAVNTEFETKTQAISAASDIIEQFREVADWRDEGFEALGEIDTGEAYQRLQSAVALAAGFLVEISFSLRQERSVTLDRDRTIIDLAAELYGSVDDQLDFLISTNDLTGSEILELPRGRKIVYYV